MKQKEEDKQEEKKEMQKKLQERLYIKKKDTKRQLLNFATKGK